MIPRIIPALLLKKKGLVKTTRFKKPVYIGDPINSAKLFNDKEVDELFFLDTEATKEKRDPDIELITEIAGECFMPVAYGGGITTIEQIRKILGAGCEKVVIGRKALEEPGFIRKASDVFGSQSIVVSIDIGRTLFGERKVFSYWQNKNTKYKPEDMAQIFEQQGAGEILVTSVRQEGTMMGYDIQAITTIANRVRVPVIASGGAGRIEDLKTAAEAGASAVAAGSFFVFSSNAKGVLINVPDRLEIEKHFG